MGGRREMYTFVYADNTEKLEIHTQVIQGYEYLKLWISLRVKLQVYTNIFKHHSHMVQIS